MATLNELQNALVAAHNAKDTNSAQKLADEITKRQTRSWSDVPGEALSNIPSSAGRFAEGMVQPILNPIDTATALGTAALSPMQTGRAIKEAAIDRYGSMEGLKNTLATDPVGVLGDVSTILTGGGMGAAKAASMMSKGGRIADALRKTGEVSAKVGDYTNPLTLPMYAGKKAAEGTGMLSKALLAAQTGTGIEPISQAVKSGMTGNKSFVEQMRGTADIGEPLNLMKQNLAEMMQAKNKAYKEGIVDIKNDKSVLDFNAIDTALVDAEKMVKFKGKVKDKTAATVLENIKSKVNEWKYADPNEFHTPEAFDALKQSIYEDFGKLGMEEKTAYSVGKNIYETIKGTINKQAPTYANVMKDYSESSELIKEIERALSLGKKGSADTATRKLQSLMRNNVNTNYGQRLTLAKELESAGGNEVMPALAGQALSSFTPRGLQGATAIPSATIAGYAINPAAALGSLLTSSPRLVGEAAYLYGKGKKYVAPALKGLTGTKAQRIALLLTEANKMPRGSSEQEELLSQAEQLQGAR